jgi:hypothetical protein
MAEPGGISSKLGTHYERRYAIWQLVKLVTDQIVSLKWEPASGDSGGADIDLVLPDGTTEHIQLKRQNRAYDRWSPAVLEQENVLSAAATYVDASAHARFRFASSLPVPHLREICDELKRHEGSDLQFIADRIRSLKDRSKCFNELLKKWALQQGVDAEEALALRRLRVMRFEVVESGDSEQERIDLLIQAAFDGDPAVVIGLLEGYLEQYLGKTITTQPILNYLAQHGHRPRDLHRDPQLRTTVGTLRDDFIASLQERLVARTWIPRKQVEDIASQITGENPPRLVLVHGKAGTGKSGVLLGIVERLKAAGIVTLPLSLSAHPMDSNALRYGESLGLKATPAAAIRAVAYDGRAVLVIDQLDALRLTTTGATSAWGRCASMIREAVLDPHTVVVAACRTFDLEHDANIMRWRETVERANPGMVSTVDVGTLTDSDVLPLLQSVGVDHGSLPQRLKTLLRHPATLDAWYTLARRGDVRRDLASQAQLIAALIGTYRNEAAQWPDVADADVHRAIELARVAMEQSGKLSIPEVAFDACQAAMQACCSVGLFIKVGGAIGFPHQSYFDYLVARASLAESGGNSESIVSWVKQNQGLERRDQLRQLLFLLHDQDAVTGAAVSREMILDPGVRFHLKHLVLGVLKEVDPIKADHRALVVELLGQDAWREHIVTRVLWRSKPWFQALHADGVWSRLLASSAGEERAMWMHAVLMLMESCPGEVDVLLSPAIDEAEGVDLLGRLLGWWDPSEDSPKVAEIRDHQIRSGKWAVHDAMLDRVAKRDPQRLIRLIDCMIRGLLRKSLLASAADTEEQIASLRESSLEKNVPAAIRSHAATAYPVFARLVLLCERFKQRSVPDAKSLNDFTSRHMRFSSFYSDLAGAIRSMTAHAVVGLSETDPENLKTVLLSPQVANSAALSVAIAVGLGQCATTISDEALAWLFADESRLGLKDRFGRDRYGLAAGIIRRHSGACSSEAMLQLEASLLGLYPDEEKRYYRYLLQDQFTNGVFGHNVEGRYVPLINPIGSTQHLLLSAIPEDQRSYLVSERIRAWDTKFGGPARERSSFESSGGMVGSPIPDDHLCKISDQQWLTIIERDWGSRPPKWKQIAPDRIAESSHTHFANNFGAVAKRQAPRCVSLARRFPEETPAVYFVRLCDSLANRDCDLHSCNSDGVEDLLNRARTMNSRALVIAACRVIEHHPQYNWTEPAWQLLNHAASHEDPKVGEFSVHSGVGKDMRPDLETTSLNCVRGVAAEALASLIWDDQDRCDRAMPLALKLAADAHPAVRIAAAELAMAAYSVETQRGIAMLRMIIDTQDDRVLAGQRLNQLIGRVRWCDRKSSWTRGQARGRTRILRHWELRRWKRQSVLPDLFARMVASSNESVSQQGAHWVTAERLQFGTSKSQWRIALRGSGVQRKAIAETLGQLVMDDNADGKSAETQLIALFSDSDDAVRAAASNVFRRDNVLDSSVGQRLAAAFVRSAAFIDNPEDLIWPLSQEAVDLLSFRDVILASADRLAKELAEESRSVQHRSGMAGREQSSLLLRLYDSAIKADRPELASLCLDRWDVLLERRVGQAETHLESLTS